MGESKVTISVPVESNDGATDATVVPAAVGNSPSTDTVGVFGGDLSPLPAPVGFVIERQIGIGGMGVVYLAHQQGLNGAVAIKTVRSGGAAGREAAHPLPGRSGGGGCRATPERG